MDLVVDAPGTVTVDLEASGVPLGTTISIVAKPEQDGQDVSALSQALTGTQQASTTTADITLPAPGLYFLEAVATFEVP